MLKVIQIQDKASDRFVAQYRIKSESPYDKSEEDCCNEAWAQAIAEGMVNQDRRPDY